MAGDADQNKWKDELRIKFPQFFNKVKILDIGSADINGTNRPWFTDSEYIGLDIAPFKGVDVVSIAHEYDAPDGSFDVVCSTSELEHDIHWKKTLQKMVDLIKSGGFMWFEAPHVWSEHGTSTANPMDSLTVKMEKEWACYYKNMDIDDINSVLDLPAIFSEYELYYAPKINQPEVALRFWGIKR